MKALQRKMIGANFQSLHHIIIPLVAFPLIFPPSSKSVGWPATEFYFECITCVIGSMCVYTEFTNLSSICNRQGAFL